MMGDVKMGDNFETSVVDSYDCAHDVDNLIGAGASLFPIGAAVNSTIAIYAPSTRTANHMFMHWMDYAR